MSLNNFIPAVWAGGILKALDKQMVFGPRCNRNYEGEIKAKGDRVKIIEIGSITVTNYTKNSTSITYQKLDDASKFLIIDQSKYFAFSLDDVDSLQGNPAVLEEGIRKGGVAVADEVDQLIAGLYTQAGVTANLGTEAVPLTVKSADVHTHFLTIGEELDKVSCPTDGRWAIIPPWMKTKLLLAKLTNENPNSDVFANGYVGRFLGFDIFVSNNVSHNAEVAYRVLAGTNAAITFASQVAKVEALRLESAIADGIRGLYLYGAKVALPNALACARVAIEAEA